MKKGIAVKGLLASRGLLKIFSWGLMGFFILFFIINTLIIGIQTGDFNHAVVEMATGLIKPLEGLEQSTSKIIEESSLIKAISKYPSFFYNLYKLYLWFWAIGFIVSKIWMPKETHGEVVRFTLSVFMGFIILIIARSLINSEPVDLNGGYQTFKSIFLAINHTFSLI